jgi:peptidoglycan/xylan/chitin deacetylase (PgdA/CDA1 family)
MLALLMAALAFTCPFATEEREIPVVMYHLVTENSSQLGKYGITPNELRADLKWLADNGYTTVTASDVVAFAESAAPLPPKPIVLSFDDGNAGDYNLVLPLLEEFDARAVIAIIGKATDKCTEAHAVANYPQPNMLWEQVIALHESGRVEIANHSYNLHGKGGIARKKGESREAYFSRLLTDLTALQEACTAHGIPAPITFVYPLGELGDNSREILQAAGIRTSLSCQEGRNFLRPGDTEKLWRLHRTNRPHGRGIKYILESMEKY